MARRDWLLNSLAIEPDGARTCPSTLRLALVIEHVQARPGDHCLSIFASPLGLPCSLKPRDTNLGSKTCH
jgi:uncharacterized protein (DUF2141 family)